MHLLSTNHVCYSRIKKNGECRGNHGVYNPLENVYKPLENQATI